MDRGGEYSAFALSNGTVWAWGFNNDGQLGDGTTTQRQSPVPVGVGCYISGTFYSPGTVDPSNACQVCTPATSTSAWSNVAVDTSCGAGEICDGAGNCVIDCYIGSTFYSCADAAGGLETCDNNAATALDTCITSCDGGGSCIEGCQTTFDAATALCNTGYTTTCVPACGS